MGNIAIKKYNHFISENLFAFSVTAIFLFAAIFNVSHHELWRDEMEHWLIGKDCSSLWQLITINTLNQGHPILWSVLIYYASKIYDSYISMQILHVLIITSAAFIFLKYSPFKKIYGLMIIFGYFFSFEYCVIARNYALGVLFLVILAFLMTQKTRNHILISICLFLMCWSNAYAFILAFAVGSALALEISYKKNARELILKNLKGKIKIGAAVWIFVLGLLSSAYCMMPNQNSSFSGGWNASVSSTDKFLSSLAVVHKAVLPFPNISKTNYHFWNTNIVQSDSIAAVISLLFILYVMFALIRAPFSFMSFTFGVGAIAIFTYVKFEGSIRHHGHIYLIFVFSLFLREFENRAEKKIKNKAIGGISDFCEKHLKKVFFIILAVQFTASIVANGLNYMYPFSAGKYAAEYLKKEGLSDKPIIGNPDSSAITLAGYLDRKIRYANFDRDLTFFPFDKTRRRISEDEFQKKAQKYLAEQKESIVMVSNRELKNKNSKIKLLQCFDKSIVGNETFWIYLYEYGGQ